MRKAGLILALLIASLSIAVGLKPSSEIQWALTGLRQSPSRGQLNALLGEEPVETLVQIAIDENNQPQLRISAYVALGQYDQGSQAELSKIALSQAINQFKSNQTGTPLLYLRASLLSFARVAGNQSLNTLSPLLFHSSRDVRASCAYALGESENPAAIPVLLDRRVIETETQVLLAITDALFALNSD